MLGDRDSYPGLGRTSTTYWEPGQVFTDIYRIPVDENAACEAAPAQIRVWVGLYDRAADQLLTAAEWPSGNVVPGVVAEGRLPANRRQPDKEPGPALGNDRGQPRVVGRALPHHPTAGHNRTHHTGMDCLEHVAVRRQAVHPPGANGSSQAGGAGR